MAFFFFNKKRASLESKKFAIKQDTVLARQVWNLLDTRGVKHALKGLLYGISNIKYRRKFYFKKTQRQITLELVKKLSEQIKAEGIPVNVLGITTHYMLDTIDKDKEFRNTSGELFLESLKAEEKESNL